MGRAREELNRAIPVINRNTKAKEMIPALAKVIEFDLEGEQKAFYVVVDGDELRLKETTEREPEITVSGDAEEVGKIVSREREITHPIAEGKVWVSKGKLSRMIIFDRVLNFQQRQ